MTLSEPRFVQLENETQKIDSAVPTGVWREVSEAVHAYRLVRSKCSTRVCCCIIVIIMVTPKELALGLSSPRSQPAPPGGRQILPFLESLGHCR